MFTRWNDYRMQLAARHQGQAARMHSYANTPGMPPEHRAHWQREAAKQAKWARQYLFELIEYHAGLDAIMKRL